MPIRWMPLLLSLAALPAAAEEGDVMVRPLFDLLPTLHQLDLIRRHAGEVVTRAEKGGQVAQPVVAMTGSTTLISLESAVVCNRAKGCPMLVFRDTNQPPLMVTASYENIALVYRGDKVLLILKSNGPDQECLLPVSGRATCKTLDKPGPR
jgi:hypothetical protein